MAKSTQGLNNPNPQPPIPIQQPAVESPEIRRLKRADQMKKYFAEQPRETIRIRAEEGDQTVRINGYGFRIQAGVKVKVPVDVAEALREADII
jgi:hypothetical protein